MISTRNKSWGFYGASVNSYELGAREMSQLWGAAIKEIMNYTGWPEEISRDFLDSRYGRNFSDDLSFGLSSMTEPPDVAELVEVLASRISNQRSAFKDFEKTYDSESFSDLDEGTIMHLDEVGVTSVDFYRKPGSWDEVPDSKYPIDETGLDVIDEDELYRGKAGTPSDYFAIEVPQYFILARKNGNSYLINTEGYRYARYAVKLPKLESKTVNKAKSINESFMEPEVFKSDGWEIETSRGTYFLPSEVEPTPEHPEDFEQYVDGKPTSFKKISGWFGRMSAPGYLDSTDWTFGKSQMEVEEELEHYYGNEDELEESKKNESEFKDDDISELKDLLSEIEDRINDAVSAAEKARSFADHMGGEVSRVVAGQLEHYLINNIQAFADDERQIGSVPSLVDFLDNELDLEE